MMAIRRTNLRACPDEERSSAAGAATYDQKEGCVLALMKEARALRVRGDVRGACAKLEECRACGRTIRDADFARKVEVAVGGSLAQMYFPLEGVDEAITKAFTTGLANLVEAAAAKSTAAETAAAETEEQQKVVPAASPGGEGEWRTEGSEYLGRVVQRTVFRFSGKVVGYSALVVTAGNCLSP